ncbi:MAG: hypothetical protein JEZ11_24645 [Desulfobacterales bacterium]|nr:hypothetical protein [Desulfobacterales bacterium]
MEHNLPDDMLEEVLTKALHAVRLGIQRPARKFRAPAMEQFATSATRVFKTQMSALMTDIQGLLVNG